MKRNYILALVCLILTGFGFEIQAQILTPTYPSPAQAITRGLDQSLLTVDVAFTSNCNNDTITVCMPASVTYVTGSITKIGGTQTISEGNISDLRKPQFVVSNVTGTGDIRFTILREAACGSDPSGKDTILVKGSCGTASEASGTLNTYNLLAPSLSLAAPAAINNAIIGTTATRNLTITNGGNGDADTIFFYVVYPDAGIVNTSSNQITANGTSFSPTRTSGDTLFYSIFGATLFGGDNLITNGESIAITEPMRVVKCNTTTSYGAGWGVQENNVCSWATRTANVSMRSGVAILGGGSAVRDPGFVDKCTNFDVDYSLTNSGTGDDTAAGMYNVKIYHGYGQSNVPGFVSSVSSNVLDYVAAEINGNTITSFDFSTRRAVMALENLFATDPDGAGGLTDLDGDGFFDDLPRGETITYTLTVDFNCNRPCGQDLIYYHGANISYDNMCGDSLVSDIRTHGNMIYEASFAGTGYVPANIADGVPFRIILDEGHYINSSFASNTNTRYRWKLVLPAGISVSGTGNPTYGTSATTYTQVADTVFITSSTNSLQPAAIDLVMSCAGGGGGSTVFSYQLDKINNITTSCFCQSEKVCATLVSLAYCPLPCPNGPTNYVPVVERSEGSLGWTDNSLATRVAKSAIGSFDLSKALYLDTIEVTGFGRQNSSIGNLHQFMSLTRTSADRLQALDANVRVLRGGTEIANYSVTTATSTVNGGSQEFEWDLSSGLPVGGMLPNDSFVTVMRYVVSTNTSLPQNDVQTGMNYYHYSIIAGVREGCGNFVPEMYLVGTSAVDGRNNWSASGCNPVSDNVAYLARRFAPAGTLYTNEFRPVFRVDSFLVINPPTFTPGGVTTNFSTGVLTPVRTNGDTAVYHNPGNWRVVGLTVTNSYGAFIRFPLTPTCETSSSQTHQSFIYISDYYYALGTRPTYPTTYQYVLGNGSSSNTINDPDGYQKGIGYNGTARPNYVTQNLTGEVKGTLPQHSWDVEVRNNGTNTGPYFWIGLNDRAGTGVSIDSVVDLSSGNVLSPNAYAAGTKRWYEVSTTGLASSATNNFRVYFKYSSCDADSIKFITGWNCSAYPSPDPDASGSCSTDSIWLKVVPAISQIQISVVRQPGNGSSIALCTTDSVLIRVNSAQDANVVDPVIDIFPPAGLTISSPLAVEYPNGSGLYENLTPVAIPGGVRVNLNQHTGIGSNGLPGLVSNPGAAGRQAKLKVDFTTSCTHTSGASIAFRKSGNNPCGSASEGSLDPPVRTNGVDITGASTPGGAGATLSIPVTSLTCNQTATVPFTVTPVSAPTQAGDTAIYTLPANISYGGNFTTGANCASCAVSTTAGPAGTTLVKVALQTGVASGTPLSFGFDITANPGNGCGSETITAAIKRDIPPLSCMGTPCPSSSVNIGSATSSAIDVTFPDLSITSYTGDYVSYNPAYTYRYTGTLQNSSTTTGISSGTSTVLETWFDMDKNNMFDPGIDQRVHVQTITDAVAANNGTANFIDTFSWIDGTNPPDPTRGMFTVIRNSTSPNCMCSPQAMSSMVAGLPVSWSLFNATKQGNNDVLLEWITEMERNSSHFEVQRKFAYQAGFKTLANVNAAGTSFNPQNYSYTDKHNETFSNIVLYRIKQVDLNGKEDFSPIRSVYYNNQGEYYSIAPNPAENRVVISTSIRSPFQYKLMDAASHIIASGNCTDGSCEIDLSNVSAGVYFVSVKNELGVSHIEKLVITK